MKRLVASVCQSGLQEVSILCIVAVCVSLPPHFVASMLIASPFSGSLLAGYLLVLSRSLYH